MKKILIFLTLSISMQSCSDKGSDDVKSNIIKQGDTESKAAKLYCTDCITITGQDSMRCEASCLTRVLVLRLPPSKRICEVNTKVWSMDPVADAKYKFTVYSLKYNFYSTYTQVNIGAHHVLPGEAIGKFYCSYTIKYEK
jgi:hypothetical protein